MVNNPCESGERCGAFFFFFGHSNAFFYDENYVMHHAEDKHVDSKTNPILSF
jgi:hypothetical protein